MALEDRHTRRADGKHFAHALANSVEFRVAKQSAGVLGKRVLFHSQPHEAISWMARVRIREVPIMGQKGNSVEPV